MRRCGRNAIFGKRTGMRDARGGSGRNRAGQPCEASSGQEQQSNAEQNDAATEDKPSDARESHCAG